MGQVLLDQDGYAISYIDDGFIDGGVTFDNEIDTTDLHIYLNAYHFVDGMLVRDDAKAELLLKQHEAQIRQKQNNLNVPENKMRIFIQSLPVADMPSDADVVEYEPYFDTENMIFAWRKFEDT